MNDSSGRNGSNALAIIKRFASSRKSKYILSVISVSYTHLHTDIKKKYSVSGSIFMDYRNSADFSDFNTIVYGHHMHDGSMFKSLRGYTKENDYYDSHKTFELITPDAKYHLQVFASYILSLIHI